MSEAQLSLFAGPASARRTDPITSKMAAHQVELKGRADAHRRLCLEMVRKWTGSTAAEIAKHTGLERHEPSRRLPELERAGFIRRGPVRVCTAQGTKSLTWYPV